MIVDITNRFQRNPEVMQDVCTDHVYIVNYLMSYLNPVKDREDVMFYESEIRHYKFYDV